MKDHLFNGKQLRWRRMFIYTTRPECMDLQLSSSSIFIKGFLHMEDALGVT